MDQNLFLQEQRKLTLQMGIRLAIRRLGVEELAANLVFLHVDSSLYRHLAM